MLFSAQNHNGKVTASDASGTEHSMRIEYGDFGKEKYVRLSNCLIIQNRIFYSTKYVRLVASNIVTISRQDSTSQSQPQL